MIRLIPNILLFLASLLCVFSAPTFKVWMASIAVTEYPWIFLLATGILLIWSAFSTQYKTANIALGSIAFAFFLIPIALAWSIGQRLPNELAHSFGTESPSNVGKQNVFSFGKMISSLNAPRTTFNRVAYSNVDGEELTLDFYGALKDGRRPCVVVVHGGSWNSGDSEQLPELNAELAFKGFNVAAINYRLAPKNISPAPVVDINNAIEYLRAHASELNIDTNNFILLGRSAGAQLAMVAAYTANDPTIRGVINFYGPSDMIWGYSIKSNPLIMDAQKLMEDFLGGTYAKVPAQYISSSPVEAVNTHGVPTLIIHGANDALVAYEHSTRLEKKLTDLKIPHYFLSLPWATHGCDYTLTGPSGQLTTYAVEYFVNSVVVNEQLPLSTYQSSGN